MNPMPNVPQREEARPGCGLAGGGTPTACLPV